MLPWNPRRPQTHNPPRLPHGKTSASCRAALLTDCRRRRPGRHARRIPGSSPQYKASRHNVATLHTWTSPSTVNLRDERPVAASILLKISRSPNSQARLSPNSAPPRRGWRARLTRSAQSERQSTPFVELKHPNRAVVAARVAKRARARVVRSCQTALLIHPSRGGRGRREVHLDLNPGRRRALSRPPK